MKKIMFMLTVGGLLLSCRKSPEFDQLSSQFVVSTSLDKTAVFSSYQSFYISDTVANIGATDSFWVDNNAAILVDAVKSNMIARGYTFVPRTANPDLGITLSVIKDINVLVDRYPGWWNGYWPWWWWGYPYYPYYYPWTTVYAYTTGTVILDMLDIKNAATNKQYVGVWNTTAIGALGSNTAVNIQLGVDAINDGFEQSPYIHH